MINAIDHQPALGASDKPEAFDGIQPNAVNTRPATLKVIDHELGYYTGTEHYYAHFIRFNGEPLTYTDGCKYVADTYGAHWLLDVVFSHVAEIYRSKTIPEEQKRLLVCKLAVGQNNHAVFQVDDGNGNVLATQEIEFTDFPAQLHTIWVQNGVAMLPSEY